MARYKKGTKGYRATIVIGRNENGTQKRKNVYAKTLRELDEKLAELKEQYDRGFDFDAAGTTVDQWAEKWLESYKKPAVSAKEYKNVSGLFKNHILPHIGHCILADVKQYQLQAIMNLQHGKSKSMTQKIRDAVRQLFRKAVQGGLIIDDPAEFIEMPKTVTKPRRPLTPEESDAVVKLCETHRAGLWVLVMRMCGLRRGETIPLTWKDIDFKKSMLTVNKAVEFPGNQAKPKLTKTEAGERKVPIPLPLLTRFQEARGDKKPHELVFAQPTTGKMHSLTSVRQMWGSFYHELDIACGAELRRCKYKNGNPVENGGIDRRRIIVETSLDEGITPHALRHTYCTDLFEAGVDIRTAQYLMGHADIKTTVNIYTHMRGKMLDEAQDKLEEFYNRCDSGATKPEKQPKILRIV